MRPTAAPRRRCSSLCSPVSQRDLSPGDRARCPVVYYDMTRLLARSGWSTPTGIDRVDLRYACHFLEDTAYQFVPIHQVRGTFFLLPIESAVRLLDALHLAWLDDGESSPKANHNGSNGSRPAALGARGERLVPSRLLASYSPVGEQIGPQAAVDGRLLDTLLGYRERYCFYLNASHHGVGNNVAYYVFKVAGNCRAVFYLHDIIPYDYPEYGLLGDDQLHARRVVAMAKYGDLVLVNSRHTSQRFEAFCAAHALTAPPSAALLVGVEDAFRQAALPPRNGVGAPWFPDPYFVSVGTIEPRKNHLLLLHLWRSFAHQGIDAGKLVLIGRRGSNSRSVADFLDRNRTLRDRVIELGDVRDQQMIRLVRGARAVLQPSFAEGWGMPLVEAAALGTPVLCADIPPFRECGADALVYLDPLDGPAWKREVLALARSDTRRAALQELTRRMHIPSWTAHFDGLGELLAQLMDGSLPQRDNPRPTELEEPTPSTPTLGAYLLSLSKAQAQWVGDRLLLSEGFHRRAVKFRRDPVGFLVDSRNPVLRLLGDWVRRTDTSSF